MYLLKIFDLYVALSGLFVFCYFIVLYTRHNKLNAYVLNGSLQNIKLSISKWWKEEKRASN